MRLARQKTVVALGRLNQGMHNVLPHDKKQVVGETSTEAPRCAFPHQARRAECRAGRVGLASTLLVLYASFQSYRCTDYCEPKMELETVREAFLAGRKGKPCSFEV